MPQAQAGVSRNRTTTPESDWSPDFDAYAPDLERLVAEARSFEAECADRLSGRWLTISGKPGTGKTYMARQLFERCRRYNPGDAAIWPYRSPRPICVWLDMTDFSQRMRGGEWNLPEETRNEFLVVLDDVGASHASDFVTEGVYRLLNGRMGRWTILTTNLTGAEIREKLDPRIASRMIRDANRVVRLTTRDYALPR